jgi:hypothetical protein
MRDREGLLIEADMVKELVHDIRIGLDWQPPWRTHFQSEELKVVLNKSSSMELSTTIDKLAEVELATSDAKVHEIKVC